jgi:hypothetical protein
MAEYAHWLGNVSPQISRECFRRLQGVFQMDQYKNNDSAMPWLDGWVAAAFSVLVFAPILAPIAGAMMPTLNTNIVLSAVAASMLAAASFLVWRLASAPRAPAFEQSRNNVG